MHICNLLLALFVFADIFRNLTDPYAVAMSGTVDGRPGSASLRPIGDFCSDYDN